MSSGSIPAVRIARIAATAAIEAVVSWRGRHAPLADPGPGDDPLVGGVHHPLEILVGQHLRRGVAAPAGDMGVARGLGSQRLHLDQGLLRLHQRAALGDDLDHAAGQVRLDLVEQLHRLDEADDLPDRDLAADRDVRRGPGGRRARRRCRSAGALTDGLAPGRPVRDRPRPAHRGPPSAGAAAPGRGGSATARRERGTRLRSTSPVPPDSTSSSVRSERSSRSASRSMSASSPASPSSCGRRLGRRVRLGGGRLRGLVLLGHASNRREDRAPCSGRRTRTSC